MENVLFALPFKLLGKKIVFDVYDSQIMPIERILSKVVDCLILPAEKRLEQIGIEKGAVKRFIEIENVPTFEVSLPAVEGLKREKIYLSYVGVFQKKVRGIENLVQMVLEDERFVLDIAGAGDDLEGMIETAANNCSRIHFHGKVQYLQALEIMNNSDYIVALYYPYGSNHTYASPNKSYESLFLSTPIITSSDTLVGNKVIECNTGYVVGHTLEELQSVFEWFETEEYRQDYLQKCQNCHKIWHNAYSNYRKDILEGIYLETLKEL
ncbi:MAG: hypothetical protein Q4A15_02995 [Prevotellaceae bacterium]|nr:hypothetical protein [Prevotellaceae bacterium]